MAQTFLHTLFGPGARALQAAAGSRASYARMEAGARPVDVLTERELDFIAARDSFYMASVSEDGWPYVQHRGGPAGFIRHIEGNRIGFADWRQRSPEAARTRKCLAIVPSVQLQLVSD